MVDSLTIFAYSPRIDECFVSYMREWGKKGLIRQCDRQTIQAEMLTRTDIHGQTLDVLAKCDKPCPLQDEESFSVACPKGCKQEGIFYFHIPELIAGGISMPCSLTTHSWLDVTEEGIYGQLQAIEEEFGSIKFAPQDFQLGEFGNKIPLVISRYRQAIKRPMLDSNNKITIAGQQVAKRTGGKADGETYPIQVNVHPAWRRAFLSWQQAQAVQALGYRPDPKLLQDAGLQFVDAEIVTEPLALPAADDWRKGALDWAIKQGLSVGVADRLISTANDKKACFAALQAEIDKLSTPLELTPVEPVDATIIAPSIEEFGF